MDEYYRFIFDDLNDDFNKIRNPYERLWCHCLLLCVIDLANGFDAYAFDWVSDEQNEYFDAAAKALNYEPSRLRAKILRMMESPPEGRITKYNFDEPINQPIQV